MTSYPYRKSHYGDKTVVRSSYLHNGISYTGKMTSLYWIRALISSDMMMHHCLYCQWLKTNWLRFTLLLILLEEQTSTDKKAEKPWYSNHMDFKKSYVVGGHAWEDKELQAGSWDTNLKHKVLETRHHKIAKGYQIHANSLGIGWLRNSHVNLLRQSYAYMQQQTKHHWFR